MKLSRRPIMLEHLCLLALIILQLTIASPAQDEPVAKVEGTQVATQQTQAAAANTDALRKASQNPIANLISVPFQSTNYFDIGSASRTAYLLNIEPVIPAKLSTNWNLINRIITPIIYQPTVSQPLNQGAFGFGDLNPTFFLSPAKPGKVIWGAGPTFVLPTATNKILGQGKWSMGPSVVVLMQPSHWTLGALINNVWSFAGQSSRPDVNQMLLQYFITYNLKKGYYVTWQPIVTANWQASSGNQWVVPVGGGIGRIMKLGFQPVNLQMQFYRNVVYPSGTSPWSMRWQVSLLFPKLSKEQQKKMMEMKLKQLEQEEQEQKQKH